MDIRLRHEEQTDCFLINTFSFYIPDYGYVMKRILKLIVLSVIISIIQSPNAIASDISPPKLVSWIQVQTSVDITSQPGKPVVEFSVSDDSLFDTPLLNLSSQTSTQNTNFASVERISTNGSLVTFRATALIPTNAANGIWAWNLYPMRDSIGNSALQFHVFGLSSTWPNKVIVINAEYVAPIEQVKTDYYSEKPCGTDKMSRSERVTYNSDVVKPLVQKLNDLKLIYPGDSDQIEISVENLSFFGKRFLPDTSCLESDYLEGLVKSGEALILEISSSPPKIVSKNSTIKCIKGRTTKKITGTNPKCPSGYKKIT